MDKSATIHARRLHSAKIAVTSASAIGTTAKAANQWYTSPVKGFPLNLHCQCIFRAANVYANLAFTAHFAKLNVPSAHTDQVASNDALARLVYLAVQKLEPANQNANLVIQATIANSVITTSLYFTK